MLHVRFARPLVAAAALLGGMGAAHAEGMYVGGALGAPDYSSPINGYGTGDGGRGPAYKLYGGYQLNPNFAVETSVFNLGRSAPTNGSARAYGVGVDAVGLLPLASKWTLYGSAGLAEARLTTPSGNDTSPALKLGAGVQYELSSQTALRLGYDRYRFTNALDGKPDVGATFVGVKFGF